MNVSIDTLDIHTLVVPGADTVQVVLVIVMFVYILVALRDTFWRPQHRRSPLLQDDIVTL